MPYRDTVYPTWGYTVNSRSSLDPRGTSLLACGHWVNLVFSHVTFEDRASRRSCARRAAHVKMVCDFVVQAGSCCIDCLWASFCRYGALRRVHLSRCRKSASPCKNCRGRLCFRIHLYRRGSDLRRLLRLFSPEKAI